MKDVETQNTGISWRRNNSEHVLVEWRKHQKRDSIISLKHLLIVTGSELYNTTRTAHKLWD